MRLSVCMITFNHERFIEQAVASALAQDTEFACEIVVGDDASTDSTAAILNRLEAEHPGRLRILHRDRNIGAQANFLRTLEACRGEFVAFLEGDDFWTSPRKLQRQVEFLDAYPEASFCFHRTRSLNEASPGEEFVQPASDPPALSSLDMLLQVSNPVAFGSIVARRKHLAGLPDWFVDLRLGDWPLCIMLASRGAIGFIPEEMSRYRLHPDGWWSRLNPYQRVAYTVQMLLRARSLVAGEHRDLIDRRAGELAEWWGGDLVSNQAVPIGPVVDEIVRTGDAELMRLLFSKTLARAQETDLACQRFAGEARHLQRLMEDERDPGAMSLSGLLHSSPSKLTQAVWRLSDGKGWTHAPYVKLLGDGRLAGERLPFARRWRSDATQLVFLDELGREAAWFSRFRTGREGRLRLSGRSSNHSTLQLEEIQPLTAEPANGVSLLALHRPPTGRRNLVVLRANEASLHTQWTRDLEDRERSWDLCISFYGKDESYPYFDEAEVSVHQNQDRKFTAIAKLFNDVSPLWDYDYFMFPDDDLLMSWTDITVIFEIALTHQLDLAQPSLHPEGVINYRETQQNRTFLLRYVSMVEIMAPVLSREALRVCLPTFSLNTMGFGIDYAWSKLVSGSATKIAIIDEVAILHTRPTGQQYDMLGAAAEGWEVSGQFGRSPAFEIRELGGIFREPLALRQLRREHFEPETAHLREVVAEAGRLKSDWYEPEIVRLTAEVTRLRDMLAAADALKSGWYEPELGRIAAEVTHLRELLAAADALKSGWYEPELARFAGEVERLTTILQAPINPGPMARDRADAASDANARNAGDEQRLENVLTNDDDGRSAPRSASRLI